MSTNEGGPPALTAVSTQLRAILEQCVSAAKELEVTCRLTIDWDPLEFMQCNYDGYVDVATVICINSDGQAYEGCTIGEYITRVWPRTGPQLLEVLRSWWRQISEAREELVKYSFLGGKVTFTKQPSAVHVDIAGPMFFAMELGEHLAWLACICRKGSFPDQLSLVRPSISQAGGEGGPEERTTLNISFASERFVRDADAVTDHCWLKLFRNSCIADGFPVSSRQKDEKGLELPFSLMAMLGGFDRIANYDGQLVCKGFKTLFVPTRKSGGSIVWHLITKSNGRRISYNAMHTLSDRVDSTVCEQDLYDSRHFLGWVSNASQHAGTEDGVYKLENGVYLERPGQGQVLNGVSISMGKVFGVTATHTPGQQDRGIRTSSKDMSYVDMVRKMTEMHVLLYDHDDARGWLVDGASAVLHLLRSHVARYRPIYNGGTFKLEQFQYADPKAGVNSARDVLLSPAFREVVLMEELASHTETQVTETVDGKVTKKTVLERTFRRKLMEDRVRDLYDILELMYDAWKGRKQATGTALKSLNMKLEGWKFEDVVELEDDIRPVMARLDGGADDWLRMVRQIDAVVLIGNGFGDMMKPMGDACSNWDSVPRKDFCLAVPVSRLKRIAQEHGDPTKVPIMLVRPKDMTPGVYWPINHQPFSCDCGSSAAGRLTCHRGQTLRSNGLRSGNLRLDVLTENSTEHDNGAVIFLGRKSS